MRIIAMKVKFHGLYAWGIGWISLEKKNAWNKWFKSLNGLAHPPAFWSYFHRDSGSDHLVCVSGSVFLHPMDMDCMISSSVITREMKNTQWVEVFPEINELKKILQGAAEACGGFAEFSEVISEEIMDPVFKED